MEDLKDIKGIGPAHEASLHKLNVKTINELASITEPDKFVDAAVFKAEDLTGWIAQAKDLVAEAEKAAEQEAAKAQQQGTNGDKPRRSRKSKADAPTGPRKSYVLLVDDEDHGKRGEIATIAGEAGDKLRAQGKARRATLEDFQRAGKIKA